MGGHWMRFHATSPEQPGVLVVRKNHLFVRNAY
jgi:hypothetical protein